MIKWIDSGPYQMGDIPDIQTSARILKNMNDWPSKLCPLKQWIFKLLTVDCPDEHLTHLNKVYALLVHLVYFCLDLPDNNLDLAIDLIKGKWDTLNNYTNCPDTESAIKLYMALFEINDDICKVFYPNFDAHALNHLISTKIATVASPQHSTVCVNNEGSPSVINTECGNKIPIDLVDKAMSLNLSTLKRIAETAITPKAVKKHADVSKIKNAKRNLNDAIINSCSNVNNDDFTHPKKSKPAVTVKLNSEIHTSNSFDVLENLSDDSTMDTNNDNATDINLSSKPLRKTPKPEPISMKYCKNWRQIASKIDEINGEVIPKRIANEIVKFFPKSMHSYQLLHKFLTDENIEFFGVPPKTERPRKVVIKGIPVDFTPEEIKNELLLLNFNVQRVSQLKNWKSKKPLPIFLIDIFRDDQFTAIFDLNLFLGFIVHVEAYKFSGTKQCYKCQHFNHSSINCNFKPRCVKCAGEHHSKDCTVTDKSNFICANCGGNHTANYTGCSKYPKKTKKLRNSIKSSYVNIVNNSSANLTTNSSNSKSYADIVQNISPTNVTDSTVNNENYLSSNSINVNKLSSIAPGLAKLNIPELFSNMDKIDMLIIKLEKLSNIVEKIAKLLTNNDIVNMISNLNTINVNKQMGESSPADNN